MRKAGAVLVTILCLLAAPCPRAFGDTVGFSVVSVPDGAKPPIEVGLWYPAAGAPLPTPIELFSQSVVPGALPVGHDLPLIVISHGTGGSFSGHADTALALAAAGFVVAAPTHTGDNYRDQSRSLDVGGRARQFERVIDYLLTSWAPNIVDARRIGAFGFSAGGLTVLIAAGGVPDLSRIGAHCAAHPAFFVCGLVASHRQDPTAETPTGFPHDHRVRAIAIAAPALGFAFDRNGLAGVTQPVQLWEAEDDVVLPPAFYTEIVRQALPRPPEFHPVAHAGHFDFLAPCPERLARIAPAICASERGFDRTQFHRTFNAALVAFFRQTLASR